MIRQANKDVIIRKQKRIIQKMKRQQEIREHLIYGFIVYSAIIFGVVIGICGVWKAIKADIIEAAELSEFNVTAGFVADMNEVDLESVEIIEETTTEMSCENYLDSKIVIDIEEQDLLARIIFAESGACPNDLTLYYVGSVAMNRVASPLYENDLYSMLHEPNAYGCVNNGMINKEPDERCLQIAEDILVKYYTEGETYLPSNVLGQASGNVLHGIYCWSDGICFSYY